MSTQDLITGGNTGDGSGGIKDWKIPDWERFGLSSEQQSMSDKSCGQPPADTCDVGQRSELYHEEQIQGPWWKANFFISQPVLFGTWDGVFTSCLINILSVVIFLRMGWIVGNAGIGLSVVTVLLSVSIVLVVALSAVGMCERCRVESGGVYFLISHILGSRIGAGIGIIYCFAQSVSCSLSVMGFGESIIHLLNHDSQWIARLVASTVVLLLLASGKASAKRGINVAGVKWVIRLQLVLLLVLFLSAADLLIGSLVHTDPDNGVTGYHEINFLNNSGPAYASGEDFFSIFGLFFATVTGILAGINMSGDLRDPINNIPRGTLAALGVGTSLYIIFILVLGSTCVRSFMLEDYMIAEKVSVTAVLWLSGLYLSSVSSCMGSLYGPPRILQSIANENVVPAIRFLGHGRGPNKVPVCSMVVIAVIVFLFICIGDINSLAPVVTTAFMLTYAAIDYSYFVLAMSYDQRRAREARYRKSLPVDVGANRSERGPSSGTAPTPTAVDITLNKDSLERLALDLDRLFPERLTQRGQHHLVRRCRDDCQSDVAEADFDATEHRLSSGESTNEHMSDSSLLIGDHKRNLHTEITMQPTSWYSSFCNRWVSLMGVIVCMFIMFSIQWVYSLVELVVFCFIYFYIGRACPGYFPGITEFNLYNCVKDQCRRCVRIGKPHEEEVILAPSTPSLETTQSELTHHNDDYSERERYHRSQVVQGDNFDDYYSE